MGRLGIALISLWKEVARLLSVEFNILRVKIGLRNINGACGWNVMIDSSRTKKDQWRNSCIFSFLLCILGRPGS